MDTNYLNYIIVIAEERNMTKAAEQLYVSQSSLSYYLSKLEQEIGTPLFIRAKNGLIPTPAGEMYIESAKEVVGIKERLYQNIMNMENQTHISISTTSYWGIQLFADIIPCFRTTFPNVTFSLSQIDVANLKKEVLNGTVDIALMSVSSLDELDNMTEVLRKEELLFAVPASHPYVRSHPGDTITIRGFFNNFANETFLISRKGSANRDVFEELFSDWSNISPRICEITGIPLTTNIVATGIGVALVPASGRFKEDLVHYYYFVPGLYRYNIMIHRKNLVLNTPEQAFFNLVKNYFH